MPYVDDGAPRLWYEEAGTGPPVVLLHPGVADRRIWKHVVPALAARHRVVALDQRGYGRSEPWDGPYSPVSDVVRLLDALGLERASLVGVSQGGKIALATAVERPERVERLVLVAAALPGVPMEINETPEQEARWEEAEASGDLETLMEIDLEVWAPLGADDELRTIFRENAEPSNADDAAVFPDPPVPERLREVTAATLVVTGGRDHPAFDEVARLLAEEIPDARRARIADADHMVPWRTPDELARLLLDFLRA